MSESIEKISQEIRNKITQNTKVAIFSHINPDGDAIGSSLGLYHYLKKLTEHIHVIMPNKFPDFLHFLPGTENVLIFEKETQKASEIISEADLLFFLDFNDPLRIDKMGKVAKASKGLKIMIDHHPNPVEFADYSIFDTSVCSTSELVYEFIESSCSKNQKDKDMANCLLVGIITDTGLFNHNSERSRTYEIVARLLELGADKSTIVQRIYNEYPFSRMQLLGNALHNRLKYYPEFGTAFIYLPKEDLEHYKYQIGDAEGFVNIPLSINGIKFSALFIEKDEQIKCSFRSTGKFDVNTFARKYFNGGGHLNASGGKSFENLNKTIEYFVKLIDEYKDQILNSY